MGYVYRYTDLDDNQIKYVGIVWSDNRTLEQRIKEHKYNDWWCRDGRWKIEYITKNIETRTDAEYLESHYIALYETDKWYNVKKSGWGISSFVCSDDIWMLYDESSNDTDTCVVKNEPSKDLPYETTSCYISVADYAEKAGISKQRVYQLMGGWLGRFVKEIDGTKAIHINGLEKYKNNMRKTFKQIADELGVSKQTVYKRYKGRLYEELYPYTQTENGTVYIDDIGVGIIKQDFLENGSRSADENDDSMSAYRQMYDSLIKTIEILQDQLEKKDNHIEELYKIINGINETSKGKRGLFKFGV